VIQNALRDYFMLKNANEIGESFGSKLLGTHSLEDEDKRLDIALKKRQIAMLGPQDTEEFNAEPASRVLASLGINWAREFQPPNTKIASDMPNMRSGLMRLFSDEGALTKELGNVAGSIGRGASTGASARKWSRIAGLF
jgi:hypothetical protein